MAKTLTKTDMFDFLKDDGKIIGKLALKIYGETLNQAGEQAFSEAIEIGIENTIAALYDAKVDDKEILRIVYEHWGIGFQETEERLIYEKQQATIRSLKQYLKLQGYSITEIRRFMQENKASLQIRHNKDLWKLKSNPEKLVRAIQSNK